MSSTPSFAQRLGRFLEAVTRQSGRLGWFADQAKWEGLRSVGVVESVRQVGTAEPTVERRYYLSSLALNIETFARAVRSHWGVENKTAANSGIETVGTLLDRMGEGCAELMDETMRDLPCEHLAADRREEVVGAGCLLGARA